MADEVKQTIGGVTIVPPLGQVILTPPTATDPIKMTLGALNIDTGLRIDTAEKVDLVGRLIVYLAVNYREIPAR
jgi:hypothetical protein